MKLSRHLLWIILAIALFSCQQGRGREESPITKIAFGSCIFQWEEQEIWQAVVAEEPDLFIFNGDAIYADFDGKQVVPVSRESLLAEWQKMADNPNYQFLRENVPILATWDNHDYVKHDGGAEFALKKFSQKAFLDFFQEPEGSDRRNTPGIFTSTILGPEGKRIQIVLLDTRYFKGPYLLAEYEEGEREALGLQGTLGKYVPQQDPSVSLLGTAQWAWLEEILKEPAEIRFIVSSTQIIPDQKGMDEWGNYPHERDRLFKLLGETCKGNVFLLTGNVHFSEVSVLDEVSMLYGAPAPVYEFTSSGLDHVDEMYAIADNPYRVAGPCMVPNFGLVEIDWGDPEAPLLTFLSLDDRGKEIFSYNIKTMHQ